MSQTKFDFSDSVRRFGDASRMLEMKVRSSRITVAKHRYYHSHYQKKNEHKEIDTKKMKKNMP